MAGERNSCRLEVTDAVTRLATPAANSAAVYLRIDNPCPGDDILMSVTSEYANRTELHRLLESDSGVVSMTRLSEGIPIPAQGLQTLQPGGFHIMLMGLTGKHRKTDSVELNLSFRHAGEISITAPVKFGR